MKSEEKIGGGEEERNILPIRRNKAHREKSFGGSLPVSKVTIEGVSSFMLFGICSKDGHNDWMPVSKPWLNICSILVNKVCD